MNGCCPRLRIFIAASALLFFTVGCARSFVAEGDSPFGVCVDLYECRNESIPGIIQECGIGWVRQVVRWDLIEPVKGDFKWKDLDDAVDRASEKGINIYGQFLWKAWSDPTSGDPEAIKNWVNFVAKAVARYKDKIKHWEVWNEPDFDGFWKPTSADNYVKLLKATYATAKAVDPDCRIILGGLMGWGGEYPYFPFIDELYKSGGKDYFDIAAFHPYTMPYSPKYKGLMKSKIQDMLNRMKDNNDPDKPIWITELGWPSNKPLDPISERSVTPDQQAQYLVEALEICLSYPQIKKIFWYGFRDTGADPLNSEHHYGLVKNTLEAKPSYNAYRSFILKWQR